VWPIRGCGARILAVSELWWRLSGSLTASYCRSGGWSAFHFLRELESRGLPSVCFRGSIDRALVFDQMPPRSARSGWLFQFTAADPPLFAGKPPRGALLGWLFINSRFRPPFFANKPPRSGTPGWLFNFLTTADPTRQALLHGFLEVVAVIAVVVSGAVGGNRSGTRGTRAGDVIRG
jgi:hypothetical protein